MTTHITVEEANAWADKVKLNFGNLDSELESAQAAQVLARVSQVYTVTGWVDSTTTPSLIRKIIAMMYTGWYFQRTYSEDQDVSTYGVMLLRQAETLIDGVIDGSITLIDIDPIIDLQTSEPVFYPNDNSSALQPTQDDPSLGPPKFTMGTIW